jgi:hypothetical protein
MVVVALQQQTQSARKEGIEQKQNQIFYFPFLMLETVQKKKHEKLPPLILYEEFLFTLLGGKSLGLNGRRDGYSGLAL